jgi:hypothetical protein
LYVTGTVTADPSGSGIITGFQIDHNTGQLNAIHGMPISSGGANPVRAVLVNNSTFVYVLNRGIPQVGQTECTTAYPCQNPNIAEFAVGANGILTYQETYSTQGLNPSRMIADSTGSYIYVLDHDSPSSPSNSNCAAALGKDLNGNPITACGDITAFSVNPTTGRLSLMVDNQATSTLGATLPYFPVPANPVDFVLANSYVLTLSGSQFAVDPSTGAYIGGTLVFPYNYIVTSGQLTTTGTGYPWDTLNIAAGTAIVSGGGYVYVLDNEAPNPNPTNAYSQIVPWTVGANGALLATTTGPIADDANQSNPIYLTVESKNKWFYVANQWSAGSGTAESGIAGYVINTPYGPTEMGGAPIGFGSGAGPQCLVEDPSDQFFYTANFNSSTVTGQALNETAGTLVPLSDTTKAPSSYTLTGPPTWCLVDGRTS